MFYSFHCEAALSYAAVDNGTSETNPWSPPLPPKSVPGHDVSAQIMTLSHGEFGLCFNKSDCDTTSVKMGFSGLGSSCPSSSGGGGGAITTQLDESRKAAGFQFREPQLVVQGNVTKWNTRFRASVSQSQLRPPIPYDASLVTAFSFLDTSVDVDQFLAQGAAMNGDQEIDVPRGALKFAINITNWVFAPVTVTLVLNNTLSDVIGIRIVGQTSLAPQASSSP